MRTLTKTLAAVLLALSLSSCSEGTTAPSGQEKENTARQSGYDYLIANQPAAGVKWSPTRETKNFWLRTWGQEKDKLSYVYIFNAAGQVTDYGVFKGLPVSYCVSLIPPYTTTKIDGGEYNVDAVVPGPSMDGTFSSGGDCNTKYGQDAETGSYVEFNVSMGQSYRLYDQPLPASRVNPDAIPLAPTK